MDTDTDQAGAHEPHCPVPRAAARGEGAVCLCRRPHRFAERVQIMLDGLPAIVMEPTYNVLDEFAWIAPDDLAADCILTKRAYIARRLDETPKGETPAFTRDELPRP